MHQAWKICWDQLVFGSSICLSVIYPTYVWSVIFKLHCLWGCNNHLGLQVCMYIVPDITCPKGCCKATVEDRDDFCLYGLFATRGILVSYYTNRVYIYSSRNTSLLTCSSLLNCAEVGDNSPLKPLIASLVNNYRMLEMSSLYSLERSDKFPVYILKCKRRYFLHLFYCAKCFTELWHNLNLKMKQNLWSVRDEKRNNITVQVAWL